MGECKPVNLESYLKVKKPKLQIDWWKVVGLLTMFASALLTLYLLFKFI